MPHLRKRYAEPLIKRALSHAPIVGVFGQRQVGKTTLLETEAEGYCTFDQESTYLEAESDPTLFLQNRSKRFAIDEAQLCPRLFPALKEFVRTHKTPGQFILSGSVRFTSRKAIRESLTGRISTVEILPFSHSEASQRPLPSRLKSLTAVRTQRDLDSVFEKEKPSPESAFTSYLSHGGLPGIAFFRSPSVRADRWQTQIDTLLNRDLRLVQQTSLPYQSLRDLLEYLATQQGKPFELKAAISASQISGITIKKLLFAYEALFLIRLVKCVGDEKKPTYFLEDQGLSSWISRRGLETSQDIVRCLYANLRQEIHYRPELNGKVYQFRTKNDVEIPIVFDADSIKIGILATTDVALRPKTIGNAQAFLNKFPDFRCVVAYAGREAIVRSERLFLIPFSWLI